MPHAPTVSKAIAELAAQTPEPADFSSLFDFLPIGAYRSSPAGVQLRANPALVRLNGYETEAEMLAAVRDIGTEWYVDPARRGEFRALLERDGQVVAFVSEVYRHKTRERIWVSENAHLVRDPGDNILLFEGTVEEITARVTAETALRQHQARLRDIAELVPGMVYELLIAPDGQRRYNFISAGVKAIYGVDVASVMADGNLLNRFRHPDDHFRVETETARAACENRPLSTEFRIRRADGEQRWVHLVSCSARADAAGCLRIGVMTDITHGKQAQELRHERDRAEAARQAQTHFLSCVSHELRTPLNAILGFSQLIAMTPSTGSRQLGWVQEVLTSGQHLLGLVDDILDLASAQTGQLPFDSAPVDLAEVVGETCTMLAAMAAAGNVGLVHTVPPGLRLHVDRKRLKQISANLLSNAIKYNRPGGSVIVAVVGPPAGGFLQFSVADTGLGMDAEQLARIFQPFDRLGAQRSGVAGTGLGLAICKQLAEAMGGGIRVSSEAGRGTTFFVSLPVCAEPAEPAPNQPAEPAV